MTEPLNEQPEFEEGLWSSRLTSAEMFGRLRESFDFCQEFMLTYIPEVTPPENLSRDTIKIPRRVEPLSSVDLTDLQRYYMSPRTHSRSYDTVIFDDAIGVDPSVGVDRSFRMWAPIGKPLGDSTCVNSANSIHLRCAVNPCGPCDGCKDYIGVEGGGGAE
jgi:hypothetical protein